MTTTYLYKNERYIKKENYIVKVNGRTIEDFPSLSDEQKLTYGYKPLIYTERPTEPPQANHQYIEYFSYDANTISNRWEQEALPAPVQPTRYCRRLSKLKLEMYLKTFTHDNTNAWSDLVVLLNQYDAYQTFLNCTWLEEQDSVLTQMLPLFEPLLAQIGKTMEDVYENCVDENFMNIQPLTEYVEAE